jgi:hypothetical protein
MCNWGKEYKDSLSCINSNKKCNGWKIDILYEILNGKYIPESKNFFIQKQLGSVIVNSSF